GGARPDEDHLDLIDLLSDDLQGIQESGGRDDGGSVLVVMKNRYRQALLELLLDLEALRRLDVLQVDPAKCRRDPRDRFNEDIRVFRVDLDVEHVDVGEALEEDP